MNQNQEAIEILDEIIDQEAPEEKVQYLRGVLSIEENQDKTISEVLQEELEAKRNIEGGIMSRKVYVNVTTRLVIEMDDGVELSDVINAMCYDFTPSWDTAEVVDSEITDYEVIDSK